MDVVQSRVATRDLDVASRSSSVEIGAGVWHSVSRARAAVALSTTMNFMPVQLSTLLLTAASPSVFSESRRRVHQVPPPVRTKSTSAPNTHPRISQIHIHYSGTSMILAESANTSGRSNIAPDTRHARSTRASPPPRGTPIQVLRLSPTPTAHRHHTATARTPCSSSTPRRPRTRKSVRSKRNIFPVYVHGPPHPRPHLARPPVRPSARPSMDSRSTDGSCARDGRGACSP